MKFDVLWVWMAAFVLCLVFQNFFTIKKSEWDVAYTYTNESMDYIAYGQMSVSSRGTTLSWVTVRAFLQQEVAKEEASEEPMKITVLAVHRSETNRYWQPFWKAFAS